MIETESINTFTVINNIELPIYTLSGTVMEWQSNKYVKCYIFV